jgi:Tol biopolymer transport system component
MTSQNAQRDDFDRLMSQWMEADGRVREPEHLLGSVLERTRRARQIPRWLLLERWIPVQLTTQLRAAPRLAPVLLLIAILLATIVAIAVVGSRPRVPDPFGLAANGQVAYLSNGQVYAANPDGSNPVQLTFGDRSASTPAWSRDGTRFAYKLFSPRQGTEYPTKYADFVVANADGSNLITIDREARDPSPPTWSADGRFIVYSKFVGNGDQIFVAAADGSSPPRRVGDPDTINWAPMFSPDGTKILYFEGNDRLAVMDADGSGRQVLNDSAFTEIDTALWHPDGNRVIVSAATTGTYDLWILSLDGTPDQHLQVAGRHQVGVSWSPDGNRIVFLGSTTLGDSFDLYVADADGANERKLPGVYSHINPGWSPDGRLIAAVSNVGSVGRVMLVDPDGVAEPVQIDSVLPLESAVFESASPPMWQRKAE